MNKICYDSSKFVNAEIEFSGADNETRIVLTRIRGKAKVAGAALDFVRFDLKVVYWAQYGRYFQVKTNPSPVELSGSVGGVLDWGSKGC